MINSKGSACLTCGEDEGVQDQRCLPNLALEAEVDADLDTLATALYVSTDDLLKARPELAPLRPRVGIVRNYPMRS